MKNIYGRRWSCATPGLLILLLDQSESMLQPYDDRGSRLEVSTYMANRAIGSLIQRCFDGVRAKNRCFISIIGYNRNVTELCSGWLSVFDADPLRVEIVKKTVPDGAGGTVEVEVQQPLWVDPVRSGGDANMFGAFSYAKELVQEWISRFPENPVPVIINISDGAPYYDGKDPRECMKETAGLAKEIMSLSTEDGNVLIYNVQVGGNLKNADMFPNDRNKLEQEETKFLFDISSEVPESCLTDLHHIYGDDLIGEQLSRRGARGLTNELKYIPTYFPLD